MIRKAERFIKYKGFVIFEVTQSERPFGTFRSHSLKCGVINRRIVTRNLQSILDKILMHLYTILYYLYNK